MKHEHLDIYIAATSPERFDVPLRFKAPTDGGIGHRHAGLVQSYRLEPMAGRQKRLGGRAAVVPELDLSAFRTHAVIDWVALEIGADSLQPAVNINGWLRESTGESLSVTGPAGVERYAGMNFEIKIQDPTPERLAGIVEAIKGMPRLTFAGRIAAIEVSVDWYALSHAERERLLMTDLLWRHLLPPENVWRCESGWPRSVTGRAGGRLVKEGYVRKLLKDPTTAMVNGAIRHAGVTLQPDGELVRDLDRGSHVAPVVDGTVYFGAKDGPAQIKVMHKIMDQQNRWTGTRRDLRPQECRARVEVTLRGTALADVGLTAVETLAGFEFQELGARYLSYWLPTVPFHRGVAARIEDVIRGSRSWQEIEVFRRTGVFGLERAQRAQSKRSARAQQKLHWKRGVRRRDDPVAERKQARRRGKGPAGLRVNFEPLQEQIYEALRRLTPEWGRKRCERHGEAG